MKKQKVPLLFVLTAAFLAFTLGFFLGRNNTQESITVSVPASMQTIPVEMTLPTEEETVPNATIVFPIDITIAGKEEFMALPGIGEVLAERILDYRVNSGFSCTEDLLNVKGIGKKRFENIYDLITVGG